MTRCGVAGRPIGHSLSPVLHRAAYAALGLDWSYDAHDVGADELVRFVDELGDDWRGISLTMPLKEVALDVATEVTDQACRLRSVNTLIRDDQGGWHGSNTDVPGLVAAWRHARITAIRSAVVVGAGATARSAFAAMTELGLERLEIVVREPRRAADLVALAADSGVRIDVSPLAGVVPGGQTVDMLVSTVPSPTQASWARALVDRAAAVTDVVYDPPVTPVLHAGRAASRTCVDGFALLLRQAALQVEAMTGRPAPTAAMARAGHDEIERRSGQSTSEVT